MRQRSTPIRTIAVLPAPRARGRMVSTMVRLLSHAVPKAEVRIRHEAFDRLDLDQRVRSLGEW